MTPAGRARADLRLLPGLCACWAVCAACLPAPRRVPVAVVSLGLLALLGGAFAAVRARGRPRPGWLGQLVALAALAGAAAVSTALHTAWARPPAVGELIVQRVAIAGTGTVLGDPARARAPDRSGAPRFTVRVRLDRVTARGERLGLRTPVLVIGGSAWRAVTPGTRIALTGRLVPTEPGDRLQALLVSGTPPHRIGAPGAVQRGAERLRDGLREATGPLPADAGGLLPGLVVGDTSRLPAALEADMRATGMTHLTAVSGANLALAAAVAVWLGTAAGLPLTVRLVASAAVFCGFTVLARPDPSVLRAAVMGVVGLVGVFAGRRGRGLPALCLTGIVLLLGDPWLARSYAFALSVLATGSLVLCARPWAAWLSRFLPAPLAVGLAVPAAAQWACAPVLVLLQPQLLTWAVPANLLASPAVAPATVAGLLSAACAPLWPPAAAALAWLGGLATGWIAFVAHSFAAAPAATLPWPDGIGGAGLMAAAGGGVVLALGVAPRLPGLVRRAPRVAAGVAAVVLLAVLAFAVGRLGGSLGHTAAPGWRWISCDVGQGDGTVLTDGHRAVVVDVGPDADGISRCLRGNGVTTIDLLVLTHFHADHVGGLGAVLDRHRVGRALVSPLASPAATAGAVRRALEARGTAVETGTTGLGGAAGALRWQVLAPDEGAGPGAGGVSSPAEGESSAENDSSVALRVDTPGFSAVLLGDLEPAGQARLLDRLRADAGGGRPDRAGPVDVVKVAHHGSARQDPDLYRLLAPRVLVYSAGRDNDYGHPAPAALRLASRIGALVLRTDRSGEVEVADRAGRLVAR